jgi:crotonobetainyl-CoA:carnitine CoA-transferase CaiB-like acyl-CoA transferase
MPKLSHIRVLDLSRILAGPWTGQILADLGAEVIKVERPGNGDDSRAWGPPFLKATDGQFTRDAGYFLCANRGKRSITVNLNSEEGQAIIRKLAAQSDVVLENYKVGTLDRFGLGYAQLARENPKLVYCSITGFGQDGPRSSQLAYDFLIQAMGGLMSVTGPAEGEPGGEPQKVGIPIADLVTGVYAAVAVLAALAAREVSGRGDYIDLAMFDVQVGLLANQAMNYLLTGKVPKRTGTAHPNIQPQQVFKCRDGDMVIVVGNDSQFVAFCEAIDRIEFAKDERFASNSARVRNKSLLQPHLDEIFLKRDRAEWIARLERAGVPCGPINNLEEVFSDPQVRHRQMLRSLPHPVAGSVPQVMSPFRFANATSAVDRAPPTLGQHTMEVLREIGFDEAAAKELREKGIV